MTTLVLASRNAHKLEELRRLLVPLLAEAGIDELDLIGDDGPEPVENGLSYEENALIKARAGAERTGLPTLADDSGISVEVLGGSPGIFSARWSGPAKDAAANVDLLLWQLSDVPDGARAAKFCCAAALVMPDGREVVVRGEWPGAIAHERRGSGGFGYDPIFVPEGDGRAAAELDPPEKDAVSHRRRAFTALAPHVAEVLGGAR